MRVRFPWPPLSPANVMDAYHSSKVKDEVRFLGGVLYGSGDGEIDIEGESEILGEGEIDIEGDGHFRNL